MLKKVIVFLLIFLQFNFLVYAKEFSSPNIICIDRKTERVLFNKGGFEKRKIASLTKVMTAIVVCENIDLDKEIEVSKKAASIGGSTVGIKAGDKIKARNLLYGLLLSSGNDCAIALAEGVSGSVENFCLKMTEKAKSIGAKDSNFVTPHGLDNEKHYSTCMDMAKITNYAMNNKEILKIMQTKEIELNFGSFNKQLRNTNRLLRNFPNVTGGKTGFTNGANRCLIASMKDSNMEVICVTLGSQDTDIRFNETKEVLDMCLEKYDLIDISKQMKWYVNIPVHKGEIFKYEDYIKESLVVPLSKEELEKIYVKQEFIPLLYAPVKKGMQIGVIELNVDNETLFKKDVFLNRNIKKLEPKDYINKGFKDLFNLSIYD